MFVKPMSPFVTFCQKTIPLAFDESMSYMEALYALRKYIEEMAGAVNTNAEALIQLQDYVEHYFDNLDVQEEINNKLDEMAESGELADIIAAYINLRGILAYDTVASMKTADNLVNGSFAETYGFYAKGDGGSAKYKVRTVTNEDTVDEMKIIALADDTLVAELMLEPAMNVKQFGAKGDGESDDTTSIQTAINTVSTVNIPDGTYMVDAVEMIEVNSGNKIILSNNAILKVITNSADTYRVFNINNVENVEICGGTLQGDKATHTGLTGEYGHSMRISGTSNNIYIHDITLKDNWGDGLSCVCTGNVRTERVHVYNVRRNGFSIASANEFISTDDIIENTQGTAPESGIDIEPDSTSNILNNIVFNNLITKNNNKSGLSINLANAPETNVNITINNHYSYGDNNGLHLGKNASTKGQIIIREPYYEHSKLGGILFERCYDGDCLVKVIRPFIIDYNTSQSTSSQWASAICSTVSNTQTDSTVGNIEIIEPYTKSGNALLSYFIYLTHYGSTATKNNNIKIVNPISNDNRSIYIRGGTNIKVQDSYAVLNKRVDVSFTLSADEYAGDFTNLATSTSSRTFTIPAGLEEGRKIKMTNISPTASLKLKLSSGEYCKQLSSDPAFTATMANTGDYIEIQKINSTDWAVVNINCTPTIS